MISQRDYIRLSVWQSIRSDNNNWYRNLQVLGVGGNATTFLVFASSGIRRGGLFALKIFRKLSKQKRRERFLEEIDFLYKCDHPAIMRVYDRGVFERKIGAVTMRYPFVVAEYLPQNLLEVIRADSASILHKISYIMQLLSALRYLEEQDPPVVHRDIKPQNIFVKGKTCILGDFGLMKKLDEDDDEIDKEVFKESVGPGMPHYYRTPDLVAYARNESPLTTSSDVFQLGLVAAHLFTGWNPCKASDDPLADVELQDLRNIPGGLGSQIQKLIQSMLEQSPGNRDIPRNLLEKWQRVFEKAVDKAHELEGRVI